MIAKVISGLVSIGLLSMVGGTANNLSQGYQELLMLRAKVRFTYYSDSDSYCTLQRQLAPHCQLSLRSGGYWVNLCSKIDVHRQIDRYWRVTCTIRIPSGPAHAIQTIFKT